MAWERVYHKTRHMGSSGIRQPIFREDGTILSRGLKETSEISFGGHRFHDYVYGKHFTVDQITNFLQPIYTKPIANASSRIQTFRLKLQKCYVTIKFTPGNDLAIADALSTLLQIHLPGDELHLESQVHMVIKKLSRSEEIPI